jgi:hypothetical protein
MRRFSPGRPDMLAQDEDRGRRATLARTALRHGKAEACWEQNGFIRLEALETMQDSAGPRPSADPWRTTVAIEQTATSRGDSRRALPGPRRRGDVPAFTSPVPAVPARQAITATATNQTTSDTSEFSTRFKTP